MKRRGFTLIELMVVIAIIIILAAIAIPNYLNMTARAKKSRVQADMASIATALETYKTDWGLYPVATSAQPVGPPATAGYTNASTIEKALAGLDDGTTSQAGTGADLNVAAGTNAVGEKGPINYMKYGTLTSITNPIVAGTQVMYGSATGSNWVLYAADKGTSSTITNYMFRTDGTSSPSELAGSTAPSIP